MYFCLLMNEDREDGSHGLGKSDDDQSSAAAAAAAAATTNAMMKESEEEEDEIGRAISRPSIGAEARMNEGLIRMIQDDEDVEEERERAGSAGLRGIGSLLPFDKNPGGGGVRRGPSDEEGSGMDEYDDGDDEGDEMGMEWLRSLIVRLMLHSAGTGKSCSIINPPPFSMYRPPFLPPLRFDINPFR